MGRFMISTTAKIILAGYIENEKGGACGGCGEMKNADGILVRIPEENTTWKT
jgi:hypothetical protein